jgi:hypothetical protein
LFGVAKPVEVRFSYLFFSPRRGEGYFRTDEIGRTSSAPAGGGAQKFIFPTGSASPACQPASLHPRLQTFAPLGRKTAKLTTTTAARCVRCAPKNNHTSRRGYSMFTQRQISNILPGFRMQLGSRACLIADIIWMYSFETNIGMNFFLLCPMPCSPLIRPPRPAVT